MHIFVTGTDRQTVQINVCKTLQLHRKISGFQYAAKSAWYSQIKSGERQIQKYQIYRQARVKKHFTQNTRKTSALLV